MNPDHADNFPFGANQEGFEKMIGNYQFTGAPMSNSPAQGAQVYEKIMACTPGLVPPPNPYPNLTPPQFMALCKELGMVTAKINECKRDICGAYSALSDIQTNMGTLKGNMDVLHEELGGRISAFHKKLDSTLCKVDDKISHMDENLNKTMGSLTQKLDMLCALVPQG
jgi:hypothetical protein